MLLCPVWTLLMPFRKQLFWINVVTTVLTFLQPAIALFNSSSVAMQFGVTFFDFGVMVCTRAIGFK